MILAIYTMGGCAEHYLYNTPVEKVLKESLGRRDGSEGFAAWWEILQRSQVGSNVTACAPLVSGSTALRNHKAAFDWARGGVVLFSPFISDNAVRYLEENIDDPHFQARGTFQLINHPEIGRALRYPVSVGTDGRQRVTAFERGAPHLGEHTREVLSQVGCSSAEMSALAAEGAI